MEDNIVQDRDGTASLQAALCHLVLACCLVQEQGLMGDALVNKGECKQGCSLELGPGQASHVM